MRRQRLKSNVILLAIILAGPAYAAETTSPKLRDVVRCFPGKHIIKFLGKFDNLKASESDTIQMISEAEIVVNDGGTLPDRFFIKDGADEIDFTMGPTGQVLDFEKITAQSKSSEICMEDQARAGQAESVKGVNFSLETDVKFREKTGFHDIASLKDGLKDGKVHYKKMVPGPMRVIVPTLSHVMIDYENDDTPAQFSAMAGQIQTAGLEADSFCGNAIIKVEDIQKLGADGLKVWGGAYSLLPIPNKKMLEKFSGCAADAEGNETAKE